MSVTIILQAPNTATITHTGAVSATITQSGAVSATIQQVVGQGVSVQNIVPNSVTINTGGASGGGTWGSITGTITDQTDLVTYVQAERQSYAIESPDGTSFIIVAGNDGTLAAIPPTSTAPSITTLPTISGTLNVGETLTATAGNVSGEPTPTQVLQWQRSDDGLTGWADIAGATGTTYLLGSLDEDKYIRVQQTEENILGTATANSVSTGQIQPVVSTLLLDIYPNSKVAFSIRKLRAGYLGNAIIVRRESDNSTQGIGFVNDELDVTSLNSFCSGTNGFVTTWYDQSGNGNDATQTTSSAQPKIYDSVSGYLGEFTQGYFEISNTPITSAPISLAMVGIHDNITIGNMWTANEQGTNNNYFYSRSDSNNTFDSGIFGNSFVRSRAPISSGQFLGFSQYLINGSNVTAQSFGNGVGASIVSTTPPSNIDENAISVFNRSNTSVYNLRIKELVIYNSDQSSNRTGIETNINDFYNIY